VTRLPGQLSHAGSASNAEKRPTGPGPKGCDENSTSGVVFLAIQVGFSAEHRSSSLTNKRAPHVKRHQYAGIPKDMKKIEAVIPPSRVDAVRAEFERRGIHATFTLTEVQQADGHKASGSAEIEAAGTMEDRVKVELIVGDRQAQRAVEIIRQYAKTTTNGATGYIALIGVNEALQMVPRLLRN